MHVPDPPNAGTGWFRGVHVRLAKGTVGPMVLHLRELLGQGPGDFVELTDQALRGFQTSRDLDAHGWTGHAEWAHLHRFLKVGDEGPDVIEVQRELGVATSGEMDAETVAALNGYKTARDLPANGVVDLTTYLAFFAPVPDALRLRLPT